MDPRSFLASVQHARDTLPFGTRPTSDHVRIAAKLAFWRTDHPTHRQLARAARVSRATVIRALARLYTLGLLTWTRRVIAGRGWRAQIANTYEFSSKPLAYQSLRTSGTLQHRAVEALAEIAARRLTKLMLRADGGGQPMSCARAALPTR